MNKKVYIVISIFITLFIGLVIYFLIPRSYILFQTAPQEVMVLINDDKKIKITNGDKISVDPGKYNLVMYRDEFSSQSESFELKNGETKEIVAALKALTHNASKLLQNEKSSKVIEKATSINMDKEVEIMEKDYPILKILPIETRNYTILTCKSRSFPSQKDKIALCIDITGESVKEYVKGVIISEGYNLDDYEVIWNDISL